MQATEFPRLVSDEVSTDMGKTPARPRQEQTRLERWSQTLAVIATMCAIGIPLLGYMRDGEHRLTALETSQNGVAQAVEKYGKGHESDNANWSLLFRSNAIQLEVLLKLRLSPDDKRKVNEMLTEVRSRKISQIPFTDAKARDDADVSN